MSSSSGPFEWMNPDSEALAPWTAASAVAHAFPSMVLPVPGGPARRIPLQGFFPNFS